MMGMRGKEKFKIDFANFMLESKKFDQNELKCHTSCVTQTRPRCTTVYEQLQDARTT